MKTINRPTANKHLTTRHETMRWFSDIGCVSVRKTNGKYVVSLDDYEQRKITKTSFATLPGALVCADNLVEYYL